MVRVERNWRSSPSHKKSVALQRSAEIEDSQGVYLSLFSLCRPADPAFLIDFALKKIVPYSDLAREISLTLR